MSDLTATKQHFIELLRNNGFNCFPISTNQKVADSRYKASKTAHNQYILEDENYGYIPILGTGTAIIDLDNKERYRKFAENMIKDGYMVIGTGQGWHVPVMGLAGSPSKIELFDYVFQPDKKIIEIQGPDHYCVGPGSEIFHDKLERQIVYQNKGTEKIWDVGGKDFHEFVEIICEKCNVTSRKKNNNSSYKNLRERFLKGHYPTQGTSNDYFFQAAKQCNTDGLTETEANEKIRIVYDKWNASDFFSDRPWSNIETKIREVYERNLKVGIGRPSQTANKDVDRVAVVSEILETRKLYSVVETKTIYEDRGGFLEKINHTLVKDLIKINPNLEEADYNSILFKLAASADDIPPTDKNLVVFKNGKFDRKQRKLVEDNDSLADMGFKNYNYLEPHKSNTPRKFLRVVFGNLKQDDSGRVLFGLKSALTRYLDPKISVIHGLSGVGKSTPLTILVKVMGDYAYTVELDQYLEDKFIRAKIENKSLLVFEDLPQSWKDFEKIKAVTGETVKTERGFHQDSKTFDVKLKIWASANYLPKIPEREKNPMFARRLSLVQNKRLESYPEDPKFIDDIVKEEGEKIVSWILNLPDEICRYESRKEIMDEWERIASPEIEFVSNNYSIIEGEGEIISVMELLHNFKRKTGVSMEFESMKKALKEMGYLVKDNMIKNANRLKNSEQTSLADVAN